MKIVSRYYLHSHEYLEICRSYQAIYETLVVKDVQSQDTSMVTEGQPQWIPVSITPIASLLVGPSVSAVLGNSWTSLQQELACSVSDIVKSLQSLPHPEPAVDHGYQVFFVAASRNNS